MVELTIPFEGNPARNVVQMIKNLSVPFKSTEVSEEHRIVTRDDPENIIVEKTERPWRIVRKSPYGEECLEPMPRVAATDTAARLDQNLRRQQEVVMGYMLGHNPAHNKLTIDEWLRKQQEVEDAQNLPPRTAIPRHWADQASLSRAHTAEPDTVNAAKALFSKA